MYTINIISKNNIIAYAAEELKKYLRMMMPECGDIDIVTNADAKDGFRLGLMQDFGLDVSDAEDIELDDILYFDCDEKGGIIAGSNPRSVLLSVYEYLRHNGCRWLFPGVDGEYIPMQDIKAVKYRFKPSNRYRGWCSEGAQFQRSVLEAIEFAPKLGMNVYMIQFINPFTFYNIYYQHRENTENRIPEPFSKTQALQWKRQCEAEMAKRGIQFHDIGHGFNYRPFGIDLSARMTEENPTGGLSEQQLSFLSELNGKRQFFKTKWSNVASPANTNFCMSNPEARKKVVDYIVDFSRNHGNIDYLHVWLADGSNNHCECSECVKKTPSDWYIILMNELDEALTAAGLDTRIVFISYVDTTWAPLEEKIKNTKRFTLLFAPIFRSYGKSVEIDRERTELLPYNRNKNVFPKSLGASLDYLEEWQKIWPGSNIAFEYHFWRHQCYDLSGRMQARIINEDIKAYKANKVDGVIACGSQRSYFPSGLAFYTYARTLFDTSLTYEQIEEDYFSHAYGKDWKQFRDYLASLYDALPFEFFSRDMAFNLPNAHFNPEMAKKIKTIRDITKNGRELIKSHYDSDIRVQTVAMNILMYHADFCDLISDWMSTKAEGKYEEAAELRDKARKEFGKYERYIEDYFDHQLYFGEYFHAQRLIKETPKEDIVSI